MPPVLHPPPRSGERLGPANSFPRRPTCRRRSVARRRAAARRLLVLALLLLVGGAAAGGLYLRSWLQGTSGGSATAAEWKPFSSPAGCFSVLMPDTPTENKKSDKRIAQDGAEISEGDFGRRLGHLQRSPLRHPRAAGQQLPVPGACKSRPRSATRAASRPARRTSRRPATARTATARNTPMICRKRRSPFARLTWPAAGSSL